MPHSGRYRLYLQMLGAHAALSVDGQTCRGGHGYSVTTVIVLQPGQHNVLPTRDGLDDLRANSSCPPAITRYPGASARRGPRAQPVQVRLAWVTPEQRAADYQAAVETASARRQGRCVRLEPQRAAVRGLPGDQDQLISDIAAANPNTVVVLNVTEPVAMPWLDRVRAVLLMWYPGDEGGRASADLLRGRGQSRRPAAIHLATAARGRPGQRSGASGAHHREGIDGATTYSEGLFVGYRWFDQQRHRAAVPVWLWLSPIPASTTAP